MSDDVRAILSPEALAALRSGFDPHLMGLVATAKAASSYTDSRGFIDGIGARYYVAGPGADGPTSRVAPRDRERTLIGILAAGNRPAFALAVHFYWGLMEGLDVDDIADTLLLTGAYAGVDAFTNAAFTLGETLRLLATAVSEGPDAVTSRALLPRIVSAFRR